MTDRESVLQCRPSAACITRLRAGRTEYRVRGRGVWLGGWCGTEERAWRAAHHALWDATYYRIS